MSTATTEPLTREEIDQFLARLTDAQKKTVLVTLLKPVFAAATPHTTVVYDENGKTLGDLVPVRLSQPGDRIGMTDEEREALAKMPRVTRLAWRPLRVVTELRRGE